MSDLKRATGRRMENKKPEEVVVGVETKIT